MSLSDAIAAQIMGELHELTTKIEAQHDRSEKLAELVVAAARSVNANKVIQHSQNEALLMAQVKEITEAINGLRNVEENMQKAAAKQALALLEPLRLSMSNHVEKLTAKDLAAAKFMKVTDETQQKVANSMQWAVMGAITLGVVLFAVGVAIGRLWR